MSKIKAVIMDWAGTTVDYGCFAPVNSFIEAFKVYGIEPTMEETREPMGMQKRAHIETMLKGERLASLWQAQYGRPHTSEDIDSIYLQFEPMVFQVLASHVTVLPGVLDTMDEIRAMGIAIGSTTGYTRQMMDVVVPLAAEQGYAPDFLVCPDEVGGAGRPYPFMLWRNLQELGISSVGEVLKVGDTAADMQEGKNAGCLNVGVLLGSSMVGLAEHEAAEMPSLELEELLQSARKSFLAAGADYVIRDITALPALIRWLNSEGPDGLTSHASLAVETAAESTGSIAEYIPDNPYLLLTPGPLSTSKTVREALLRDWCTWDADYNEGVVQNIRRRLLDLAGCSPDEYSTVLMQGSGSFTVEATLGSAVPKDGRILIISNGAYGKRMVEMAEVLRLKYREYALPETEAPIANEVAVLLEDDPRITHVAMVHCETTTGMLNPLEEIAPIVKDRGKVFIVDAMSSFGGLPIDVRELGIDFLVSSSNKCIQGVPGFAFIIAKRSELKKCKGNARSLCLDLYNQWKAMDKSGKWRYTSPTHVVRAFYQAIEELEAEGGLQARHARYSENQKLLVEGMETLGFKALLPPALQSPIITSFLYPHPGFDFVSFYHRVKAQGFVLYPGKITQAPCFRIGNIGEVYPADIKRLLQVIESVSR